MKNKENGAVSNASENKIHPAHDVHDPRLEAILRRNAANKITQ